MNSDSIFKSPDSIASDDKMWYATYLNSVEDEEIHRLENCLAENNAEVILNQSNESNDSGVETYKTDSGNKPVQSHNTFTLHEPLQNNADAVSHIFDSSAGLKSVDAVTNESRHYRIHDKPMLYQNAEVNNVSPSLTQNGGMEEGHLPNRKTVARSTVYEQIMKSIGKATENVKNTAYFDGDKSCKKKSVGNASKLILSVNEKFSNNNLPCIKDDVTQRYLKFIDELINEKRQLMGRCENLVSQISALERRHKSQIQLIQDKHKNQLQAVRKGTIDSEKSKRQKLLEKERDKIKTELSRVAQVQLDDVTRQHAEDITRLRNYYEGTPDGTTVDQALRLSAGVEDVRTRLLREKDDAVLHERHQAKISCDKQMEDLTKDFETRLKHTHSECETLRTKLSTINDELQSTRTKLKRDFDGQLEIQMKRLQDECSFKCEQLELTHQENLKSIEQNIKREYEASIHEQKSQLEAVYSSNLAEQMNRVREDRDVKIEKVIEKLELEMRRSEHAEAQRVADQIKKLELKHANEMTALEAAEESLRLKYMECKRRLTERDEQLITLQSALQRKDKEIIEMKHTAECMKREQHQLIEAIESEFKAQLDDSKQSIAKWKARMEEAESRCSVEIRNSQLHVDEIKQQRDKELEHLHLQIKEAFLLKDKRLEEKCRALSVSEKKAKQLESLLDKIQATTSGKMCVKCASGNTNNLLP